MGRFLVPARGIRIFRDILLTSFLGDRESSHSAAPPPGPAFGRPDDRLRGEPGIHASSIFCGRGYGFRVPAGGRPRNDERFGLESFLFSQAREAAEAR